MSFGDKALLFMELSILAYCSETKTVENGKIIGFDEIYKVGFENDQSVTIFSSKSDVVLVFRGTYNLDNLIEDADYKLVSDQNNPGKVHQGFLGDFNKLWPSIVPHLDGTKKVWAAGHSLGGALAAIATVRAARRDGPNIDGLFTYGQPRIGTAAYVADIGIDCYRWVDYNDLVPRLPPMTMHFAHFGKEMYIDSSGYVVPKTLGGHARRILAGLLSVLMRFNLGDHDVYKYRSAILRTNQESVNVKR